MSFIWPTILILLISIPLLAVFYFRRQHSRQKVALGFGSLGLLQSSQGQLPGFRRHIPPMIFLSALAILIVAMARPQSIVNLPRFQGTVILAFDVSGSMAADDLKPTRMDAAKTAAQDFVEKQPTGIQIGVVAFSDSGISVQAPTDDRDQILAAISRLTPQRGTSLTNGISTSLSTIANINQRTPLQLSNQSPEPDPTPTPVPPGTHIPAAIVILSDGENNISPDPITAARAAADQGVRIYTIGIGTPAGSTIHVNGFTVHTQLDEATLKQIAQISDGAYFNATSETDLRAIYNNLNPKLELKPEKTEITSIFAGAGILVMLLGGILSLAWFNHIP